MRSGCTATAGSLVSASARPEQDCQYVHEDRQFAGDCCYATQRHFIDRLIDGRDFETSGEDYLRTLAVQEAVYESARTGRCPASGPPSGASSASEMHDRTAGPADAGT